MTQVIFLLNVTKVGERACKCAVNLVVVDFPEGVESIGKQTFSYCRRLITVYFPTTLTSIGESTFAICSSLETVDLLHTNLQEFGDVAFWNCSELKSMNIPDSLQKLGGNVFWDCFELVPSNIDVSLHSHNDATSEVIAHLHSQQLN